MFLVDSFGWVMLGLFNFNVSGASGQHWEVKCSILVADEAAIIQAPLRSLRGVPNLTGSSSSSVTVLTQTWASR